MRDLKFTVLLRYPDYVSDDGETYMAHVVAGTPLEACRKAQIRAMRACTYPMETHHDFLPLLVIAGHHRDLNPMS